MKNADEAIAFLADIDEIGMNQMLERDIREYVDSNVMYPKRYKIRPRVYFIIIKTEAETMEDFKDKKAVRPVAAAVKPEAPVLVRLNEERFGWYEGALDFKRVSVVPGTGKFQYRDTHFVARCKAVSGMDCYNRIRSAQPVPLSQRKEFQVHLSGTV